MQQQQTNQQVKPQFTFEGGHLVMFHQENTGLPMTVDSNVNDRDRMFDLLATEKYLTQEYNISMQEASHDEFFQVLKQNHQACIQAQRQLFATAFKKGWYRLPVADAQSVVAAVNHFQKCAGEFPPSKGGNQTQSSSTKHTSTTQTSTTHTSTASKGSSDQLNRVVDQAIQQAKHGQVPPGVGTPVGGRISH